MAAPQPSSLHWVAFVTSNLHAVLNPLREWLRRGGGLPGAITLLVDGDGTGPGLTPLERRLVEFFPDKGAPPLIRSISVPLHRVDQVVAVLGQCLGAPGTVSSTTLDSGPGDRPDPSDRGKTRVKARSKVRGDSIPSTKRLPQIEARPATEFAVVLDLSADLPAAIPALAAQAVSLEGNGITLLWTQYREPELSSLPHPLIPRGGMELFALQAGKAFPCFPASQGSAPRSLSLPLNLHASDVGPPSHLMLLVNGLLDLGFDRGHLLRIPILSNLPLCRLQLSPQHALISDFASYQDHKGHWKKVTAKLPSAARHQVPSYDRLSRLFHVSGILKPDGLEDLLREIHDLAERPLDEGGDVIHIALDTNLLMDRFFSTCLQDIQWPPNVDFVLCETVRSELHNRDDKISDDILDALTLSFFNPARIFKNQNQLADRLRYIGLKEFNRMRQLTGCHEADSGSSRSSARNDRYILDAYSAFVGVGRKVAFVSRDHETIRMMRGEEGVIPFLLEQSDIPDGPIAAPWPLFVEWLHLLSVVCGRVEWVVGGSPVAAIDGVWSGKSAPQWEEDTVKLRLLKPREGEEMEDFQSLSASLHEDRRYLSHLGG